MFNIIHYPGSNVDLGDLDIFQNNFVIKFEI